MSGLIGTEKAATDLGITRRAVQRLCKLHQVGTVVGRDRVLSPADVVRLRTLARTAPGNPKMSDPGGAKRLQRRSVKSRRAKSSSE